MYKKKSTDKISQITSHFLTQLKKKERDRSLNNIIVIFSMVKRFFLTFISFNMKIKHTRTHFYTAGPILFLHDDAMNIEFSALSFPTVLPTLKFHLHILVHAFMWNVKRGKNVP